MNMGMSLNPQIRQKQELRLSPEQRIMIQSRLLALRLDLIGSLRDEKYEPKATCPKISCQRKLTPVEIIKGFKSSSVAWKRF